MRVRGGRLGRAIVLAPALAIVLCSCNNPKSSRDRSGTVLPRELPAGFTYSKPPEFFGTEERRLKNGTIFDYIDGGGVVYTKHGFREVTHLVMRNPQGASITVDIFDMSTPRGARSAFDDGEICPPESRAIEVGDKGKAYHYPPEYVLYFVRDRFLVYMIASDDTYQQALTAFAQSVSTMLG